MNARKAGLNVPTRTPDVRIQMALMNASVLAKIYMKTLKENAEVSFYLSNSFNYQNIIQHLAL